MNKTKILIIEDEKPIARFLELELSHEGYLVDIAYDGRIGLEKAVADDQYSLILLDIMLPGINGIEVLRRIRQTISTPIIMLTALDEITDKVMGLDTGADDYITKPFVIEELLARIRAALRKNGLNKDDVSLLNISDLELDIARHEAKRANQAIELTKREYDLLEYLLRNEGLALTRNQIIDKVWGFDYVGDTNVVDVYIRYLRSKVDDGYDKKLIQTIRGVGYCIRGGKDED
ncbi:Phosphate regulon transcriptional regulatory protein PhoB (SphR) [Desulfosporosinus sp. I2]|uniref:response regulator transcription factor n=1 Tax=Desulfosporosinus sp. I2 TaxID=1617025 RepID=UPI0005EEAE37|nr:response regulator transcription factor [Desulfosporosinus sp. I2]KJR49436.1 Phosphate regulon transcriptional regulatory protein PhoB (SphR) [Desulfosporosinus sp. I2]